MSSSPRAPVQINLLFSEAAQPAPGPTEPTGTTPLASVLFGAYPAHAPEHPPFSAAAKEAFRQDALRYLKAVLAALGWVSLDVPEGKKKAVKRQAVRWNPAGAGTATLSAAPGGTQRGVEVTLSPVRTSSGKAAPEVSPSGVRLSWRTVSVNPNGVACGRPAPAAWDTDAGTLAARLQAAVSSLPDPRTSP